MPLTHILGAAVLMLSLDIGKGRLLPMNEKVHAHREEVLKGRKGPSFRTDFKICKRKAKVDPKQLVEWDKFDFCFHCGVEVVYDSRDSEGVPHVCLPCAVGLAKLDRLGSKSGLLRILDPDDVALSDEELMKRLEKTISQNRHGETRYRRPQPPPHPS